MGGHEGWPNGKPVEQPVGKKPAQTDATPRKPWAVKRTEREGPVERCVLRSGKEWGDKSTRGNGNIRNPRDRHN